LTTGLVKIDKECVVQEYVVTRCYVIAVAVNTLDTSQSMWTTGPCLVSSMSVTNVTETTEL
jgi:hypothetical protein